MHTVFDRRYQRHRRKDQSRSLSSVWTQGCGALVPAEAPCAQPPLQGVQTDLNDSLLVLKASLVAQWLPGNPPARLRIHLPKQETEEMWVRSLGQEDPLGEELATHSSILAWEIPWTEESGRLQSMGSQRVRHDWATKQLCINPAWVQIQLHHLEVPWTNKKTFWASIYSSLICE